MASVMDMFFRLGLNTDEFNRNLREVQQELNDLRAKAAHAQENIAVEGNNQALLNIKTAEQNLQRVQDDIVAKGHEVNKAIANYRNAQKQLKDEKVAATAREQDPNYYATSAPTVKRAKQMYDSAVREEKKAESEYNRAVKKANNDVAKVSKEDGKVNSAQRSKDNASAKVQNATLKFDNASREYLDRAQKYQEALDKINNGGSLVSTSALKNAQLNKAKADDVVARQQSIVNERKRRADEALAEVNRAEQNKQTVADEQRQRVNNRAIVETNNPQVKEAEKQLKAQEEKLAKNRKEFAKLKSDIAAAEKEINVLEKTANQRTHLAKAANIQTKISEINVAQKKRYAQEMRNAVAANPDNQGLVLASQKAQLAAQKASESHAAQLKAEEKAVLSSQKAIEQLAKARTNLANLQETKDGFNPVSLSADGVKKAQKNFDAINESAKQETANKKLAEATEQVNKAKETADKKNAQLARSENELVRKQEKSAVAQQAVAAQLTNVQEQNARKLDALNQQQINAGTRARLLEQQKANALKVEAEAEQNLANAIQRRNTVANTANNSVTVANQRAANLGNARYNTTTARDNLTSANTLAVQTENDSIINAVQQKLVASRDRVIAAINALRKVKDEENRASQQIQSATARQAGTQVRVNTTQAQTKLAELRRQISNLTGQPHKVRIQSDGIEEFIGSFSKITVILHGVQAAFSAISRVMGDIVSSGYEYAKSMESSRIGIAGIYASMTEIDGKRTTYQEGLGIANEVVQRLQAAATITAATPTDMVRTFQGLAAPGLGAGMTTDELIKYTTVGVNAAKAMQLPATQFIQELRDMIQGGIQPASSTIATALGLKDADIKAMQQSADGLFKSLMEKMQGLAEGANMYVDTMTGKQELLKQTFVQVGAKFSEIFEVEIKNGLETITDLFADVNTKTGEFTINPAIVNFVETLHEIVLEFMDLWGDFEDQTGKWSPSDEALELWKTVCEFGEKLKDLVLNIAECFVAWSPLLGSILEGFLDAVGFLVDIASWLIRCATWLGEILSQSELVKKVFYFIGALIGPQGIVGALGKVVKLIATILSKSRIWQGIVSAIGKIFDKIASSAPFQKIMGTTAGKVANGTVSHSSTILGGLGTFGGTTGLGSIFSNKRQKDDFYKVIAGWRNNTYGQNKDTNPYGAQNAKSIVQPKADDKEAKKRAQALLAANKQALKQQTQLIKDNLAEQLEILKNTMESVKLAFDQYRIGWQEYSAEKAENAVQQQQAKVDAIKQEITATQNSGAFKTQEELTTAIGKLQVELNKETRTLEKLVAEQKDVADVIAFYGKQSLTPYSDKAKANEVWSSDNGPMPESVPLNAFGSVEQWLMHYYVSHGIDKEISAALVGNQKWESGNWSDSAIRGDGISQWQGDRLASVYDFMKQNGLAYADIRNQAAATINELPNYIEKIKQAIANGASASNAVSDIYEAPNPAYANNVKRQEYTDEVKRNFDETATALISSASTGLIEGLNAGFNAFAEQTMDNGRVGCVEAVTKIGSWFSTFLKNEFGNVSVPNLQSHAKSAGIPEIPYDESKLKPGDVIVYGGDEHVLIYKGNGRTVGNASNALGPNGRGKVVEQGIDIGMTPTSIIQTGTYGVASNADMDPATKAGQEAKKLAKERLKNAQDTTKEFLALLDDESTIQKEQLLEKYAETIKKLTADGYKEQAAQAQRVLEVKLNQLDFKTESNYLKTALNVIESNASELVYKISDEMYDVADMAKKYLDYYNHNNNYPGGNYGLQNILDNLHKQLKVATDKSDIKTATEIDNKIKSIQKELMSIVDKFVQAVKDKASWRISMIEANPYLTTGQKEGAKGKIERDTKITEAKVQRLKAEQYYQEAQKLKNADGSFINVPNVEENYKNLIALSNAQARAAALNEELTKMIPLLDQVGNTAKQSLEDGLLTFLTDSVNEAQSLGEALRNLAITILKDLQKMFAKNIVRDMMNKWFPAKQNEGNATTEAYNQTMVISQQIGQLGQTLAITASSFQTKATTAAEAWNNALGNVTTNFITKVNTECARLQSTANSLSASNIEQSAKEVAAESADAYFEKTNTKSYLNPTQSFEALKASVDKNTQNATMLSQQSNKAAAQIGSSTIASINTNGSIINATGVECGINQQIGNEKLTQINSNIEEGNMIAMQDSIMGGSGGGGSSAITGFGGYTNLMPLGSQASGLGAYIGNSISGITAPITNIVSAITKQIASFLNSSMFTSLLNSLTSITGSAGAQLAGGAYAIGRLINGDTKEKLLSMIFLELQLLYIGQNTIIGLLGGLQQAAAMSSTVDIKKKASGGYISGPGTGTSDSIPAMLSNGEYVVKANAVRKYGRTMLDQLNSGSFGNLRVRIPKFATGGYVGQTAATATSSFATSFGASVSPQLHVNNYVDGKRIFDTYGKDVVRSEVKNSIVKNAKFFAETMRRI